MKTNDLYSTVTSMVIRQLEEGVPPWVRPWKDDRLHGVGMIPTNLVTGRRYSGGNILLLWLAAHVHGYSNLQFCTYQQLNGIGASVRKGEKATHVIFTKHIMRKGEGDDEDRPGTLVKTYPVFHFSQIEKIPEKYLAPQQEPESEPQDLGSPKVKLARGCGVHVQHGGNRACYIPSKDEVQMPPPSAFVDDEAYWQTLMHEFTHATAHEKRCGRKLGKRFGDEQYAFEELVAELGSAFLCARLDIPAGYRSASYIDNWLKVLKQDTRAIFTAASYAGQASDYLWNKAFHEEKQLEAAE
ncbi:ArdC family protein [Mesorhizobium sp. BR-1-1-10]|uniref:ArdC family protein n=1 Tax=Mesorhizobium sp. BR-1-1-10 TaxID=2876660 RepID=UPI001CD066F0|nr:zincin-like metallopeptidase domain-containing protein [Mesorhizobium sp. BR-1-1-10]MBZ9975464.1 ssDNA-binding domain-containing protein [Mesorhizobium sp. BR-1-1-10]